MFYYTGKDSRNPFAKPIDLLFISRKIDTSNPVPQTEMYARLREQMLREISGLDFRHRVDVEKSYVPDRTIDIVVIPD